ncbi:AEC family transporter, partial [Stutzerimonas tarimensis]
MFSLALQTLSVTAPVFAMLFLGALLRRLGWIDAAFINTASNLVFKGTMPVMLFLVIQEADLSTALQPRVLGYFAFATLATFTLAWGWAILRVPRDERGVYVQGAFRGNNGIVGLALAGSVYGAYGLSLGAVLAGLVILLFNGLSVMILAIYSRDTKASVSNVLLGIARNPLIIGVMVSLPFAYWEVALPQWLTTSGEYFARLTLPLALICIGGTLSLASLRASSGLAISASLMKMVWLPALATFGAWLVGLEGPDLGILFIYFACPTAAASFVMAKAVGANDQLAAAIIVITT